MLTSRDLTPSCNWTGTFYCTHSLTLSFEVAGRTTFKDVLNIVPLTSLLTLHPLKPSWRLTPGASPSSAAHVGQGRGYYPRGEEGEARGYRVTRSGIGAATRTHTEDCRRSH